jgi:hypothetical protein
MFLLALQNMKKITVFLADQQYCLWKWIGAAHCSIPICSWSECDDPGGRRIHGSGYEQDIYGYGDKPIRGFVSTIDCGGGWNIAHCERRI